MMPLIVVSGASGAGKTTLALRLASTFGAQIINVGDLIVAALNAASISHKSRQEAGQQFLRFYGESALGPLLLQRLLTKRGAMKRAVVLDGLRVPAALNLLSAHTRMLQIHLDIGRQTREKRLELRGGWIGRDNPVDELAQEMRRYADFVLDEQSLDDFTALIKGIK